MKTEQWCPIRNNPPDLYAIGSGKMPNPDAVCLKERCAWWIVNADEIVSACAVYHLGYAVIKGKRGPE